MYGSYSLGRAMVAPVNSWASAVQALWSHPAFPGAGALFGRSVASASELLERATRSYAKPPFGLETTGIDGRTVAVREVVCLGTPFCNLVHFERDARRRDPKVLVVAPLSGHHASLLRDTVQRLLPDHDLYLTDWIDARFVSLNVGRHADAHRRLYRDLLAGDEESAEVVRRFYDDYLAVMDLPAEYYLQTIASVFQRHDLARGEMVWRGKRPVRPTAIEATALFTIEGEKDDITGAGQTFAAHDLCTSIPAGRRQE